MKRKVLPIALALLALPALLAPASTGALIQPQPKAKAQRFTVVVAGGAEENSIRISLTGDGREVVVGSIVPLEVEGTVCRNPEGNPKQLRCPAPRIAGFVINAGPGDDRVVIVKDPAGYSRSVDLPVTLRGGEGKDILGGGLAGDKLLGGPGDDHLIGGPGDDHLVGGPGNDHLIGGRGEDQVLGGPGDDYVHSGPGNDRVYGGPGDDRLRGGAGEDMLWGGPGNDDARHFRGLRGIVRG